MIILYYNNLKKVVHFFKTIERLKCRLNFLEMLYLVPLIRKFSFFE